MIKNKKLTIEELKAARGSKVCKEWLKDMYAFSYPAHVPWVGFWGTEEEWDDFCKVVIQWVGKHKAELEYIKGERK